VKPRRILHSGKTRAQQTAGVWGEILGGVEVAQADAMYPAAGPTVWAGRLGREADDLMLVGHLPHLRRLASLLLCGDAGSEVVAFENGGVVCLERNPEGRWALRWALIPGIV
jgi:phosphohistidine phosphatase